jgi:hypothetical protein
MWFKIFHNGFGKNHLKNISISKVNAKKVSPTVHILSLLHARLINICLFVYYIQFYNVESSFCNSAKI